MNKQVFACALAAAMMLAAASAGQEAGKVELKLTLPKPMFIGTPTNIKSANLEVITGKSRAAFFVPVGTKLLSLKKPIQSSDSQPVIGELPLSATVTLVATEVDVPATVRLLFVRTTLVNSFKLFTLNAFVRTFCTRLLMLPAAS